MAKKTTQSTLPPRERAFLIGVELRGEPTLLSLEDSLAELALLAETADLEIVGETTQKLDKPNPETYIGSGKVEELKILVEETLADLVIFELGAFTASPTRIGRKIWRVGAYFGPNRLDPGYLCAAR